MPAAPEAAVPVVGPFVAIGRHGDDLTGGHQATLGIFGALQILGLAGILVGSLVERRADSPVAFQIDGGLRGGGVRADVSW